MSLNEAQEPKYELMCWQFASPILTPCRTRVRELEEFPDSPLFAPRGWLNMQCLQVGARAEVISSESLFLIKLSLWRVFQIRRLDRSKPEIIRSLVCSPRQRGLRIASWAHASGRHRG
jgi:hypothetical protein